MFDSLLKTGGGGHMKAEVTVYIEKLARKSGGDRYQGLLLGKEWQVYLPQEITRTNKESVKQIKITIDTLED